MYMLNFTGCVTVFREVWYWYIFTIHNAVNNGGNAANSPNLLCELRKH